MTMIFIAVMVAIALKAGFSVGRINNSRKFWINDGKTSTYKLVATIVSTQVGGGVVVGIVAAPGGAKGAKQ